MIAVAVALLAHGALGPYDEIIFGGIVLVFVALMLVSWVQGRNAPPGDAPDDTYAPLTNIPRRREDDSVALD